MQLSIISEDERITIEKIIARHGPLPTGDEGEIIRDKLGIRKRVEYSSEVLARKREAMSMAMRNTPPRSATDAPAGAEQGNDPGEEN
jgi:hypothetical protein